MIRTLASMLFLGACLLAEEPVRFFHGPSVSFGGNGRPQRWVNLLGRVSDPREAASFAVSIDGGPPRKLALGPDKRRLEYPGDFNAEIDYAALKPGSHTALFTLTRKNGTRHTANLEFTIASKPAPLPLSVNWSRETPLDRQAQIVDGQWTLTPEGPRSAEPGYDRILAIGDASWRDYEALVSVRLHSLASKYANSAGGASLGLVVRWTGHVAWNALRPREGWWPFGAALWFGWEDKSAAPHWMIHGNKGRPLVRTDAKPLREGEWFMLRFRCETTAAGHEYSARVWPSGSPEPGTWDLVARERLHEPGAGSLLLITHYADATFGDVTVLRLNR
jgi:hypothetical protein